MLAFSTMQILQNPVHKKSGKCRAIKVTIRHINVGWPLAILSGVARILKLPGHRSYTLPKAAHRGV